MNEINIKTVNPLIGDKFPKPDYATPMSAAIDLRACLADKLFLAPNQCELVGSGIAIEITHINYAGVLLPRSGLGAKKGIVLGNLVGLIDMDYRKEVKISIWNRSDDEFVVFPGDRICQMIFLELARPKLNYNGQFQDSERGGFGSTGVK
jgi:dUTP pyrophosphatase